jgi:hypothetical protein
MKPDRTGVGVVRSGMKASRSEAGFISSELRLRRSVLRSIRGRMRVIRLRMRDTRDAMKPITLGFSVIRTASSLIRAVLSFSELRSRDCRLGVKEIHIAIEPTQAEIEEIAVKRVASVVRKGVTPLVTAACGGWARARPRR